MIFLESDYGCGATQEVLDALIKTNMEQTLGYSQDSHCENARNMIRKRIGREDADIHFFIGGTSANYTTIAAALRPHQAVISSEHGHICVHEAGAVEASGHKILAVPSKDAKILPEQIEEQLRIHNSFHWVLPKLVYITNTTDLGTIYTKAELIALKQTCEKHGLYLFLDGARLAAALTCKENDLTIEDIANYTDAFYIGGTKNGALFGEALVILNDELKPEFRHIMKQKGSVLAKGRLLGVQFEALMKDDLYFKIAENANKMAAKLRKGIADKGYEFYTDAPANQLFPIMPNEFVDKLEKEVAFQRYFPIGDDKYCIRLVTSWETTEEDIDKFLALL